MKLRDYQQKDLDEILFNIDFDEEEKQMLQAPVSYGKSALLAQLCKEYAGKVFISLPFTDLVEQIEEILTSTNIEFSVIRSGQPAKFNADARIQIALDSSYYAGIYKRYTGLKTDMLITDEAHIRIEAKRFLSIKNTLEPKHIVGLSGTPFKANGTAFRGFKTVNNITHKELIERGFIANVETYVSNLYLENGLSNKIAVNDKDFTESELSVMYSKKSVTKMVDQFEEFCKLENLEPRETKTLWFATNVEACEAIAYELKRRDYFAFSYHGKTKFSEEIMESYRNNSILKKDVTLFNFDSVEKLTVKHLVSVNKLTTGFSVNDLQVGVLTASTARLPTHIQRCGRSARKNDDMKKYILDFGGSSVTFGDFQEHFIPLDPDATNEEIRDYMSNRGLSNAEFLFRGNNLTVASQDIIDGNIKEFLTSIDGVRLGDMRIGQLLDKWYLEKENIMELVFIFLAFVKNAYSEPMTDKWGKDTVGYAYQKYNVETGLNETKEVSGFYSEKTANWLLEIYFEAIDTYPDKKKHWFSAMKTKMFNMARMKQWKQLKDLVVTEEEFTKNFKSISESIYSIRFFPEFLITKHIEELEDSVKTENNYTGSVPAIEITEDELPF